MRGNLIYFIIDNKFNLEYRLKSWKQKEEEYLNKIRQYENIINDIHG